MLRDKVVILLLMAMLAVVPAFGQLSLRNSGGDVVANPNKDKERRAEARSRAKRGIRTWVVDPGTGLVDSVATDTLPHLFQNSVFTEGPRGFYSTLGNLGSPRLSKIFSLRPEMDYFIFTQPYDFFITPIGKQHFTNTYSPITNLTYHECGNSDDGEDRFTANYAVNINKDAGVGMKFDYLYNRGFFDSQSTSDFDFTLHGSVLKDKYKAHWIVFANYFKTRENGGITDDEYITNPEKFPSSFTPREIPTNISRAWNKMHNNGAELTHRYSLGFRRVVKQDTAKKTTASADSLNQHLQSPEIAEEQPQKLWQIVSKAPNEAELAQNIQPTPEEEIKEGDSTVFVPVTSFIHTFRLHSNSREFSANEPLYDFYTDNWMPGDSALDKINHTLVSNYLAVELSEGLNKYLSAGIRLYLQHDFNNYKLPAVGTNSKFTENRLSVGAQVFREHSNWLNYQLTAQTSSDGDSWGEFELRGKGRLTALLLGDTVSLNLRASVVNRKPTFFYRHYQSKYLWWDNDKLSKQMTTAIGATIESKRLDLRLSADAYTISNYTYFSTATQQHTTEDAVITTVNTLPAQTNKNINIFSLMLEKDFHLGLINWENAFVYQAISDKNILPLPAFTAYTNLYLKFKIAKVLNTEFGADLRYNTKYYAPTYSPALGMYATQAMDNPIKVGDHPIISVYVNFHLKHTRFYVMANHVNYSKEGGTTFGAPHYPVNPFLIRFGLSWNFFN